MACRFTITMDRDPEAILDRARMGLVRAGGTLEGDADAGSITVPTPLGRIDGTYRVEGRDITVDILKKPAFVTCAKIEKELREKLQ